MRSKPDSQTRNPPRARARRLSSCYLHPADPAAGICSSCLRERLHGLDSPSCGPEPSFSAVNAGGGAWPVGCPYNAAVASPELRRSRSVFAAKCEGSASSLESRRKSCDVRACNGQSLAHLFDVDDERNGSNGGVSKVESKNILRSSAVELTAEDIAGSGEEIRDFEGNEGTREDNNDDEGEFKTMKEHIDLELQKKSQKLKDFKELAGNFWGAASVFSRKLQKWRHKQKKKLNEEGIGDVTSEMNGKKEKTFGETQSEVPDFGMGRRSCDTEPRFSIDAGRVSFDEPRASWDGYLIARTIPRLAPMLSVEENAILNSGNRMESHRASIDGGQMHSIMEDESSSGGSAQSQSNSDTSSSQRRSSFDRSSSVRSFGKKYVGFEGEEMKCGLNAGASPAKLVITERDLKDWHLNSIRDDLLRKKIESPCGKNVTVVDDGGVTKKQVTWRKKWNVLSFRQKSCENKLDKSLGGLHNCSPAQASEKAKKKEVVGEAAIDGAGWKLMRSSSIVGARRSCEVIRSTNGMMSLADDSETGREEFVLGRNQSVRYSSSNLDDGALPFYLSPLRSSSSRKSGTNKLQNSHFINGHFLALN